MENKKTENIKNQTKVYHTLLEKNQYIKSVEYEREMGWLSNNAYKRKLASAKRMESHIKNKGD